MTKEYQLAMDYLNDSITRDFAEEGGVYELYSKNGGEVVVVNRCIKVDPKGILYIGKAKTFRNRVIGLRKTIDPLYKSESHICGRRYKNNKNLMKQFPFEDLYVRLHQFDQPEVVEKKKIEDYFLEFGEVPPLNATS